MADLEQILPDDPDQEPMLPPVEPDPMPDAGKAEFLTQAEARIAAIANPTSPAAKDVVPKYSEESLNTGEISEFEQYKGTIQDIDDQDTQELIQEIVLSDRTDSEKLGAIFDIQNQTENQSEKTKIAKTMLYLNPPQDPDNLPGYENMFTRMEEIQKSMLELEEVISSAGMIDWDEEAGVAENVLDFGQLLTPGNSSLQVKQVLDEAIPELANVGDYFLTGELIKKYMDHVGSLPVEEQVEVLKRVSKSIDQNLNLGNSNDMVKWILGEMLLGEGISTPMRMLENVFGVLDYGIGVAGLRGAVRLSAKSLEKMVPPTVAAKISVVSDVVSRGITMGTGVPSKSPLGHAMNIIPEKAQAVVTRAIDDPAEAAALGIDQADAAVSALYPKMTVEEVVNATVPPLRERTLHSNFSDKELNRIIDDFDTEVTTINGAAPKMQVDKIGVEVTDDGYIGRFMLGKTDTQGFSDLAEAQEAIQYYKNKYGDDVHFEVWQKDLEKGIFNKMSESSGSMLPHDIAREVTGEFNVSFKVKQQLTPGDAKSVEFLDANGLTAGATWLHKAAWLKQWLGTAGNVMVDNRALIETDLQNILHPLYALFEKNRNRVLAVLRDGEVEQKIFDYGELHERFKALGAKPSEYGKLVDAYIAAQRHQKVVYEYFNRALHDRLKGEGFFEIEFPKAGEDYITFARRAERLPTGLRRVVDTNTGERIELTPELLEELKADPNVDFVKFRKGVQQDDFEMSYGIIRNNGQARVRDIPAYVLKSTPGYITRAYDARYLITKKRHVIRDTQAEDSTAEDTFETVTVGVASNGLDAERIHQKVLSKVLQEEGEEAALRVSSPVRSRELNTDQVSLDNIIDQFESRGQLYYSKRQRDPLMSVEDTGTIRGIAESIELSRRAASRAGVDEVTIQKLLNNWKETYGKIDGFLDSQGRVPLREGVNKNGIELGLANTADEADLVLKHIKALAGLDENWFQRRFRDWMITFSENILEMGDNGFVRALSDAAYAGRNLSQLNPVKAFNFYSMIVANMVRQVVMQPMQMSVYFGRDGAASYLGSGQGIRDFNGLMMGLSTRNLPEVNKMLRPKAAAIMGLTLDEYDEFLNSVIATGMHDSIDTHVWAQIADVNSRLTHFGAGSGNPMVQMAVNGKNSWLFAMKMMRRFGFDAGERLQLLMALLVEKNAWQKANPSKAHLWNKKRYLDQISGKARTLSLDMNQAGALRSQRIPGVSIIAQFMSHVIKSSQMLLPTYFPGGKGKLAKHIPYYKDIAGKPIPGLSKLSNKAISDREKGKIFLTQLALFGTGAFGVNRRLEDFLAEQEVEAPPEAIAAFEEGVLGMMVNYGLEAVTGNDVDLEFSQSLAPFAGVFSIQNPAMRVYEWGLLSNTSLKRLLGPTYGSFSRAYEGAKLLTFLAGDHAERPTGETALVMAETALGSLAPVLGKITQSRLATNMGRIISTSGNPSIRASSTEILANTVLGVQPREYHQIRSLMEDVRGRFGDQMIEPDEELFPYRTEGDQIYETIKHWLNLTERKEMTVEEFYAELDKYETVLSLAYDDLEYAKIIGRVQQRARTDFRGNDTEAVIVQRLANIFGDGADPAAKVRTKVKNMSDFKDKEIFIELMDEVLK